jgi:FAD/FMN-containing dehydrogenase
MPVVTVDRDDPRFPALRKGHNLRFPATDAEAASRIVLCADAADCASALQRLVSAGIRPTIRSGGHCYEDFVANNPSGAILDLSLHSGVGAEAGGKPYVICPGAMLGDVYQRLCKQYGVMLPAGTCYTVGAGGHISGGGYGRLSRLHGLTSDWITGIDILTVDLRGHVVTRRIDKDHDAGLFLACRGAGGGNFGLITAFHFDHLPAAPREVALASLSIPWEVLNEESFTRLLIAFGEYWEGPGQAAETWGLSVVMTLGSRGKGRRINLDAQFCNPDGTARNLAVLYDFFQRFREFDPQLSGAGGAPRSYPVAGRLPWLDAVLSEPGGLATRGKYKSTYMKRTFTSGECTALYELLGGENAHGFVLEVDGYGGAINNPERARDTAIVQRSSVVKLQWQCYWDEQSDDARHLKFMDDLYTAVYTGPHVPEAYQGTPFGPRYEGCYINYPDADMLRYPFWPQLYYGDLYPFLQKIKDQYDPHNIFHSSMSIRPLTSAG